MCGNRIRNILVYYRAPLYYITQLTYSLYITLAYKLFEFILEFVYLSKVEISSKQLYLEFLP